MDSDSLRQIAKDSQGAYSTFASQDLLWLGKKKKIQLCFLLVKKEYVSERESLSLCEEALREKEAEYESLCFNNIKSKTYRYPHDSKRANHTTKEHKWKRKNHRASTLQKKLMRGEWRPILY